MLYLLAIVCPPMAVFLCGRVFSAILTLFLCLLCFIPGVVHALMIVTEYKADKRMDRLASKLAKK
jgi:uncharacterized membrane protein YqaE (UPF0057 family)